MTLTTRTNFTEAAGPHVSFFFGRLSPPHFGHRGLIQTTITSAKAGAWAGFLSKSHDNKKNPLTYDQKLNWVYTLYPETKGHIVEDPSIKTFLQAAAYLYSKGFRSATFVAGEDDMAQMRPVLEKYNGKEMGHGFYSFNPLTFMESPRLTSATNARQAAKDGDPDAFERATQVPQNLTVDGKTLFQTVRLGLGLSEEPPQVQEGKSVPDVNYGIGSKPGQTFTIGDIYGKKSTKVPHAYLHSGKNKKRNKKLGIPEAASLSVEQLAHISDAALDDAYHYGLSTPGANFGWLANIESATAAKRMIDSGITDVEAIANAIHDGWNKTAMADYMGKLQLDTPTIGDKKKKRYALAQQTYAQLPEVEKEKDRVVARAMLQALGIVSEAPGIGGDWGDNPKLVKRGRKPYEPNVDDTYYGSTHGVDLDLYGLPKYELDEDLTPEQWAELRVSDPRAYRGDKDYTNRRWWTLQFKKARATARDQGAQRFEFPPGSKNSYMVAPDLANEELEEYTVFDIHREFFEEISKLDRKLFENSGEYESLQNLLTDYDSAKPVIGKKYIYVSISSTPVAKIMNIAKFNNAHTLIGIENNRYIFNINGSRKLYPETGSMQGDALQKVFLLDSTEYLGQMLTQLSLRFSDWKITFKELPENKINEAASEKSTKAEAKYQAMPRNGQRCDHCTMWRPPHGCSAVAGKIAPNGWCSYYKRSHRSDLDENMDHSKDEQAVSELKAALLKRKSTLQNASDDTVYDTIDSIMTRIAKAHGLSGQEIHDMWVKKYGEIPDTWIMGESQVDEEQEMFRDKDGYIDMLEYAKWISSQYTGYELYESADYKNINHLDSIYSDYSVEPIAGKEYSVIMPIYVGKNYLSIAGFEKPSKLLKIENNKYTFANGETYPKEFKGIENNNLIKTMFINPNQFKELLATLSLRFNIHSSSKLGKVEEHIGESGEQIDEAASPVLFHYTGSLGAALNILKNNEFALSISTGTVEAQYAPKGYNYFLSATRSKVGGYHQLVGDTAVMFNLDGNWFNKRYPVKAIDYWAGMYRGDRHSESEDRIFSREPSIPADAITAIHILLKEKGEYASPTTRQLMILAKKRGLPTYLYTDDTAWRLQDTRRALPVSAAKDILSGIKRTNFYVSSSNFGKRMLGPWLELIFKKKRSELSKKANDLRYSLTYWNGGQFGGDLGLRSGISDARKPGNSGYEEANKIIAAMRKIGASDVKDLLMFLHKKWDAEAQQPAKSDNAAQSAIAKIRASAAKKESVEEALDPNETHGWILPNRRVVYVPQEYHAGYLEQQGIGGYEEAYELGYVRFAKATVTFFVEGKLADLKKMYRVYAQTALEHSNVAVDIVTDAASLTLIGLDYVMPRDKAKFIKKFGPQQNEHAGSIIGTVGGGNDYPDRQVAVFPWDRWVQPDTGSGEVSYIRKSRKFKKK